MDLDRDLNMDEDRECNDLDLDKNLVYQIVRDAFQKDDAKARHLRYSSFFNQFFFEACSRQDLLSLTYESTPEGLFEVLHFVADHLLSKYSMCNEDYKWRRHVYYTNHRHALDALLLANYG